MHARFTSTCQLLPRSTGTTIPTGFRIGETVEKVTENAKIRKEQGYRKVKMPVRPVF